MFGAVTQVTPQGTFQTVENHTGILNRKLTGYGMGEIDQDTTMPIALVIIGIIKGTAERVAIGKISGICAGD